MELEALDHIQMIVVDSSSLTGSLTSVNPGGFEHAVKVIVIDNQSNVGFTYSLNGVKEAMTVRAGGTFTLDSQANHATSSAYSMGSKVARKGQEIWGSGSAGVGNIIISGFY